MNENPTAKKQRALMFLELMEESNVREVSTILGVPLSTIQKHDNALKRLTGMLGEDAKTRAFESLDLFDSGLHQIDAISDNVDHKMVSDLVAMRWAIVKRCAAMEEEDELELRLTKEAEAKASKIQVGTAVIEERIRNQLRLPIDNVTEAFNVFLALAPLTMSTSAVDALEELTEVIIDLEETFKS